MEELPQVVVEGLDPVDEEDQVYNEIEPILLMQRQPLLLLVERVKRVSIS